VSENQPSRQPPILPGERVVLRPARPSDAADRFAAGRDPELVWAYGGDPARIKPMTPEGGESFYRQLAADPYGWAIEHEGRCIGSARLHSLSQEDRRARYAVGIFDSRCWSRGLGTEVTRLVLRCAFETLGLHRVDLRVLADNERAIRCYLRCGFVREGLERDSALVGGVWRSDVFMSVLEDEYRRLAPGWFGAVAGQGTVRPATAGDLSALLDLAERRRREYAALQPTFWRPSPDARAAQARYFARLIEQGRPVVLVHEAAGPDESSEVDGFLIGQVVDPPPVYAPGGPALIVDDFAVAAPQLWPTVGRALLEEAARRGGDLGTVQTIVVCGQADAPKRDLLAERAFSPASEWWVRPNGQGVQRQ
jgi:RimJ/RimL family protein N-acetyltransferase